jgi:hypothetical protein
MRAAHFRWVQDLSKSPSEDHKPPHTFTLKPTEYPGAENAESEDIETESQKTKEDKVEHPLAIALQRWRDNRDNDREESWQQLFSDFPYLLMPILGGRAYSLQSRCYAGGTTITGSGANILDFLVRYSANVACIEIKTPFAKLMGKKYRSNVFMPSRELVGACVQVLESRRPY